MPTLVSVTKNDVTLQINLSTLPDYLSLGWVLTSIQENSGVQNIGEVIGPEVSHVINVALQLQDQSGNPLDYNACLHAYLSDVATGKTITAAAPDGGVVIGTNGGAIPIVAGKVFMLTFETNGMLDLNLTNSVAATWYLVVILPDGTPIISGSITF